MKYFWLYLIVLILVIFLLNWLNKFTKINGQQTRKLTHTLTGMIVTTFPFFLSQQQILILSAIFIVLMAISKLKKILVLHKVDRATWGEVYFPASVGICAFISLPEYKEAYMAGMLCLTFADTSANIIGLRYPIKKIRIGKQTKSLGGFLACMVLVFIIFSVLHGLTANSIFYITGISVIIGIVELVCIYGTDNLTVPVMATVLSIVFFA